MFFLRCKEVFLERKYYYLGGYLFGFVVSLCFTGVKSIYYLFPIKVTALCFMLPLGTIVYYSFHKVSYFSSIARSVKYVIFMNFLILITYILKSVLLTKYNIDITPIIGFE